MTGKITSKVRAPLKRHAFGRALEDVAFDNVLKQDDEHLTFSVEGSFWLITSRYHEIVSGPMTSYALGVELFRRWTGKEVS